MSEIIVFNAFELSLSALSFLNNAFDREISSLFFVPIANSRAADFDQRPVLTPASNKGTADVSITPPDNAEQITTSIDGAHGCFSIIAEKIPASSSLKHEKDSLPFADTEAESQSSPPPVSNG